MTSRPIVSFIVAALSAVSLTAQTPLAPTSPPAGEVVVLSPFVVLGDSAEGYSPRESLSATRIRVSLDRLPVNMQVLSTEFLTDLRAREFQEVLRYTGATGTDSGTRFSSDSSNAFQLRGFAANTLRNGFALDSAFSANIANSAIDRIEVLKGPASLLYGSMNPGGAVNLISKRPTPKRQTSVDARVGERGYLYGAIDTGGPLGNGLGYRVNLASEARESVRVNFEKKKYEIAPVFEWRSRQGTEITFEYNYVYSKQTAPESQILYTTNTALPASQQIYRLLPADAPSDLNFRSPDDHRTSYNEFANLELRQRIGENFNLRVSGRWYDQTLGLRNRAGASLWAPGIRTYPNDDRRTTQEGTNLQADLVGNWTFSAAKLTLLTGVESSDGEGTSRWNRSTDRTPIDFFDRSTWINARSPALSTYTLRFADDESNSKSQAAYASLLASAWDERLTILAGTRYTDSEGSTLNKISGATARQTTTADTYQIGALGKITKNVGLFASYSQSFVPQGGTIRLPNNAGTAAPLPLEGEGVEIGVKASFLDDAIAASISYFDVDRKNIIRLVNLIDPITNGIIDTFNRQSGLENAQGFDIQFNGRIGRRGAFILNYTKLDAKVVSDENRPVNNGRVLEQAPDHSLAMFGKYRFSDDTKQGFYVGSGIVYRSEFEAAPVDNPNLLSAPAGDYTTMDAFIGYSGKRSNFSYDVRLSVANAFNERAADSLFTEIDARAWQIGVSVHF
jgi:iron complex outermembrane receptor protein